MDTPRSVAACLDQIRRILTDLVPASNWHSITAEACVVGSITEVKSWYTPAPGAPAIEFDNFDLDYVNEDQERHDIGRFVSALRELTYVAERGAWYTAELTFQPTGTAPAVRYNYEDQPRFSLAPPLAHYRQDLKLFPRPAHLVPDWLQEAANNRLSSGTQR